MKDKVVMTIYVEKCVKYLLWVTVLCWLRAFNVNVVFSLNNLFKEKTLKIIRDKGLLNHRAHFMWLHQILQGILISL